MNKVHEIMSRVEKLYDYLKEEKYFMQNYKLLQVSRLLKKTETQSILVHCTEYTKGTLHHNLKKPKQRKA